MAGGDQLNPVDYPPLPSTNLKQNNNSQISSFIAHDREKNNPAAKVFNSTFTSTAHESIEFVVGSVSIPPITPFMPQISIPKNNTCVDEHKSVPPPHSLDSHRDVGQQARVFLDKDNHVSSSNPQLLTDLRDKVISSPTFNSQEIKGSNLAKAFQGIFEFQPCHQILGKPCVSFSMEDKYRLLSSMNYILVVKFSHFRPKFHDFIDFLTHMKFQGKYRISEFDMKHVFVEFIIFEDFIKIWRLKSSIIGGFKGRFFQWDSEFKPNVESFIAPVWVHLPHFPLYLFDEKAIISVAKVFGKPMCIESASIKRDKVGRLSVCVAKDVRVKGPSEILIEFVGDGIIVDRFNQLVNYGEIPDYCSKCLHMGHCLEDCKVLTVVDKDLGAVSSRLKVIEDNSSGNVIPLVSVFNRVNRDIAKKHSMVDDMVLNRDLVMVEDASDKDEEDHRIAAGKESHSAGLIMASSDSSAALSLEHHNSHPAAGVHGSKTGNHCFISKVDVPANKNLEAEGEELHIEAVTAVDEPLATGLFETSSGSYVAPSLQPHLSNPGAIGQGLMADNRSLITKVDVRVDKKVEASREDPDLVAETSVDEPIYAELPLSKALSITYPGPPSIGSLEGTSGDVIRWLSKQVGLSIQDNLQQQKLQQKEKVDGSSTQKILIKDPVTKEIVNLSQKASSLSITTPIPPVAPVQKKAKKKKKKVLNQPSVPDAQQDTVDLIATSEAAFHKAAVSMDTEVIEGQPSPSQMPPASPKDVQVTPVETMQSSSPSSSSDTSQEHLDLVPLLEAYHKGHFDVQSPSQEPPASPKDSTPLSFEELAGVSIKAMDTQATCDEVTKTSKKNTSGPSTSGNSVASKVSHSTSASKTTKPLIPSLGVQVTVKTKVKEADDNIKEATNHKVPKELFFFPPRPSTPAGVTSIYASKKFNKEFLKPP